MSSPRRAPRLARATAVWLVGLWAFGLLASLAHANHGVHRYCDEHGQFEEAGLTGERPGGVVEQDAVGATQGDAHQSCPFAGPSAPYEPGRAAVVSSAAPAPPPPVPAALPARAVPPPSIPLLALAPKSSPPSSSI